MKRSHDALNFFIVNELNVILEHPEQAVSRRIMRAAPAAE